jgi:hypothetical protein
MIFGLNLTFPWRRCLEAGPVPIPRSRPSFYFEHAVFHMHEARNTAQCEGRILCSLATFYTWP